MILALVRGSLLSRLKETAARCHQNIRRPDGFFDALISIVEIIIYLKYINYMKLLLDFDYKKATQAINFLAKKEGGKINKMKAVKLIYFAERYHLRKYGRLITNDRYLAMTYGPVGSTIKDILDSSDFMDKQEKEYAESYISQTDNKYTIASTNNIDEDAFSESDLEALEFAYKNFGKYDQFALAEISHMYPEWAKFEKVFSSKEKTREDMDYLDFFSNTKVLHEDKFKNQNEELVSSKEIFIENAKIAEQFS